MEKIVQLLESKGIRPTAMRLMTYKRLAELEVAISLGDLEKDFKVSERSTLFRTIKTFEEKGVVHQIEDGTGVIKYALCEENCECEVGNDLHLHFHCNNCNETVCLTEHKIPHISLPDGYITEDINLVVKGICEKCSDNLG
ncbi:MAG TPA: transcriptional repressor [Maribacter sp.]|jgi:Fur family ferric uptake transcriptional regulator|uniref:Fur family transcriptional regulator n=1 Tax=Maribacter sp. UBA6511 TaxID=1946805 RepID=UPI000C91E3B7|nr:transcriptional repressor [Maribacter sp. UBA6511]MAL59460.1 transcriptional repressor [Flavobacteriaceae bacterium]HAF76663.1 transcriptional repressor [Maribacter sp.]HAT65476.1 transcriptional repressor [Flavobacteriaceae bacterium]|tara:strand:+ start:862 stop:1284 length:423 start_codon:yes stop_codon:yes gene_type:complete